MNSIVTLNFDHHQDLCIVDKRKHDGVINQHLLPVVPSEFLRLAACLPIVISKNGDTGRFTCSAMMGFEQGENLFVKQGQWDAPYQPLQVQRQPFFVGDDGGEKLICFDSTSSAVSDVEGIPLFKKNGAGKTEPNQTQEPSDYLKKVQWILSELVAGEQDGQKFLERLVSLELLTPLLLDIVFENGQEQTIRGAYCIDEERMSALSDHEIVSLHNSGYLKLIHAMQVSLEHFQAMVIRKNELLANANSWFEAD